MQAAQGYPEPVLELRDLLNSYLDPDKVALVLKAYEVAAEAHRGQTRKSGDPYIFHPVAVAQILANLSMDHESIVAALLRIAPVLVQPEYDRNAGGTAAVHSQLHPVTDRGVLGLTHAPDVTFLDMLFDQHIARFVDHSNSSASRQFESFVVRAVLFRLLSHKANVLHGAHGGGIKRIVMLTEIDHFQIDGGVAGIGNDGLAAVVAVLTLRAMAEWDAKEARERAHRADP